MYLRCTGLSSHKDIVANTSMHLKCEGAEQPDTAGIRFCDVTVAGQQSLPSGCLASSASSMKRWDARAVFCVVLTRKMSSIYTLILFFCG